MFNYQSSKNSGAKSWVLQRISGLVLVVLMIGHYILMHYHPDSGHTFDAVLTRMQFSWYRIIDIVFITFGFYHGLNGIWGIFRDYKLKPWLKLTIMSVLILLGISFLAWGYQIIFSIPFINTFA